MLGWNRQSRALHMHASLTNHLCSSRRFRLTVSGRVSPRRQLKLHGMHNRIRSVLMRWGFGCFFFLSARCSAPSPAEPHWGCLEWLHTRPRGIQAVRQGPQSNLQDAPQQNYSENRCHDVSFELPMKRLEECCRECPSKRCLPKSPLCAF